MPAGIRRGRGKGRGACGAATAVLLAVLAVLVPPPAAAQEGTEGAIVRQIDIRGTRRVE